MDACIKEGGLQFSFPAGTEAIKFDDTEFYRMYYNHLPESKGVDIIANADAELQLIEIKDCKGYEQENRGRTQINNGESFDVEVSLKVASTINCLYGVWTRSRGNPKAEELLTFWKGATSSRIPDNKKTLVITLVLEGDFGDANVKSRSKKMIMKRIQDSIQNKLKWLQCKVMVVDMETYNDRYFQVVRAGI